MREVAREATDGLVRGMHTVRTLFAHYTVHTVCIAHQGCGLEYQCAWGWIRRWRSRWMRVKVSREATNGCSAMHPGSSLDYQWGRLPVKPGIVASKILE